MPNPTEIPKLLRPSLAEMSAEDVKKLSVNSAAFITNFRAEILKAGYKEESIRELMKDMLSMGECGGGVMCLWCT